MAEPTQVQGPAALDPLPYHRAIVDFLKRTDPDVWNWLSRSVTDPKATEEVKFDLLKATYRLEKDTQPSIYAVVDKVATQLGISAPATVYQSQNPQGLNASLAFVPGEIHLILHGAIAAQLTPLEVRGLVGHELSHYLLWQAAGGELLIACEMLRALTCDARAHPAHFASLRLMQLYNEIFCDRGAYHATQDLHAVVSMLVKVSTGVQEVSAEGYLRQAAEIFEHGTASAGGTTHPEAFIRAHAIKLWAESHPDAQTAIERMIEGTPGLNELDLLAQERISAVTRRVIDMLLQPKWFQTEVVLAHARLFFEDYVPPADLPTGRDLPAPEIVASLRDYFCFVLLDFVSSDRELDEAPLAAALHVAEQLGIKPRFGELARRELRLRKNQIEKIDEEKVSILAAAQQSMASSP